MGLLKTALITCTVLLGVGAVGGIAAGVVVSRQNATIQHEEENNNTIDSSSNQPSTPSETKTDLDRVLNNIEASNVIIKPLVPTNGLMLKKLVSQQSDEIKKSTYAFDINKQQLDLEQQTLQTIPSNVTISFDIDNKTQTNKAFNEGKLNILVKAELKNEPSINKTKKLELNGFKQADKSLFELLNQNSNDENKVVLNLTKPKKANETISLKTLEELNAISESKTLRTQLTAKETKGISGLSALLKQINKEETSPNKAETVVIEGKVKLEKITKSGTSGEEKTNFHLISSTPNPLKLIDKKSEETSSVLLVDEIIVSNLLASSIRLIPVGVELEDINEIAKAFKENATTSKNFKGSDEVGYSIEVKKTGQEPNAINVPISINLVKRTQKIQDILVNLEVSFGSETGLVKTYSTTKDLDIKELKDAGFSFDIYTKKIEGDNNLVVDANKINNPSNKLEEYFNKDSKNKTIKKENLIDSSNPKGGYKKLSSSEAEFKTNFKISQATSVMQQKGSGDTPQEDWVGENWISFISYCFKGMNENEVLVFPLINLIHIKEHKIEMPVDMQAK